MKKSKKKAAEAKIHQHEDYLGRVFGSLHPIDAKHKNIKTQKFHEGTVNGYPNKVRKRV
ncbi:MAG TPA: hypothetical protein VMX17_11420 [Candidatus Glassbacteria bacterium]|nr:hypothetical protein [Candidatus Glassbacteria bacterium]